MEYRQWWQVKTSRTTFILEPEQVKSWFSFLHKQANQSGVNEVGVKQFG